MTLGDTHRTVFQVEPKFSYSELFFLDEATALAAGHRPCRDCQPHRFAEFKRAWCKVHCPTIKPNELLMAQVDQTLQAERIQKDGRRPTFSTDVSDLPVGTFLADGDNAYLLTSGGLYLWSFDGYAIAGKSLRGAVTVLTPPAIVAVLKAGYVPQFHGSANA